MAEQEQLSIEGAETLKAEEKKQRGRPKSTVQLFLIEVEVSYLRENASPVAIQLLTLSTSTENDGRNFIIAAHYGQPRQKQQYQRVLRTWKKDIKNLIHDVLLFDSTHPQYINVVIGNKKTIGEVEASQEIIELLNNSMRGSFIDY